MSSLEILIFIHEVNRTNGKILWTKLNNFKIDLQFNGIIFIVN